MSSFDNSSVFLNIRLSCLLLYFFTLQCDLNITKTLQRVILLQMYVHMPFLDANFRIFRISCPYLLFLLWPHVNTIETIPLILFIF